MMKTRLFLSFFALAAFGCAATAPGFKLTGKFPVGGAGGFDYIVFEASANRLYVSHGAVVEWIPSKLERNTTQPIDSQISGVPSVDWSSKMRMRPHTG